VEAVRILHYAAFLVVTGGAFAAFGYILYSRYRYLSLGQRTPGKNEFTPRDRLKEAAVRMFGHRTLLKDKKSGLMHLVLFYGFIALQFGALDLVLKGLWEGARLPVGPLYPLFLASQELTAAAVLAAVAYAAYRRYIEKLSRLKRGWKPAVVLLFIGSLMLSVLFAQGMELLWHEQGPPAYQPLSSLIAVSASALFGIGSAAAEAWFYAFWWLHLLILLAFLLYVPQSKHAHILFAPVNLYLRKSGPPGRLSVIDLEDESKDYYGAQSIQDFSPSQLMDLYACVECGRCTSVCPASGTGKRLSPMHLITNLRDHLTAKGASITSLSPWVPSFAGPSPDSQAILASSGMVGDIVSEQELWACTTCRNCEEVCPVGNEHVDKIMEMRRYLVLTEGSLPAEAARTLANLERQGNPWGRSRKERDDWRKNLPPGTEAPLLREAAGPVDYLLHVGSMGAYDQRSMKITTALITIMNHAGISFAVLGAEERNSGDTARRLGNEYLYQQLAEEYVELLNGAKVPAVITIDPHAYNTFKNEYPDFGLDPAINVYHHTELLEQWVREGRIRPVRPFRETVTFHDPCYLGRHNGVYGSPRSVLASVPELRLTEMERSRDNSMCCGAGGGLMWVEEHEGSRINETRTEQALEVKPSVIATACPYCLTMMGDGVKAKEAEERVRVLDIAEILAAAI